MSDNAGVFARIDEKFDDVIAEIRRYLGQMGSSHTGEGIRESAEMAAAYIASTGADTRLVETDGNPVAFGKLSSPVAGAPTLIIYSLYDVVPFDAKDWTTHPLAAEVIDAPKIRLPEHYGKVIVGRGANNQRGPMLATIEAVKAIKEAGREVPVNILWVWEGEEEIGCPHLPQFIERCFDELNTADAYWMPNFMQDAAGRMVTQRGYKGTTKIEMRIRGGAWGGTLDGKDLWSAQIAWVDAPLWRLMRALTTLIDEDQRISIDGFWERIRPWDPESQRELEKLQEIFDEREWKQRLNIERFKGGRPGREMYADFVAGPILNCVGITGTYTGPKVFTTLPMDVTAKLDIRFPPDLNRDDLLPMIRAHLDKRGFTEVELEQIGGYEWSQTPASDPINRAAAAASAAHGVDYYAMPIHPAVNPASYFNRHPLYKPISNAGLGRGGNNHQPNEWIAIEGVRDFMKWAVTYLEEWASQMRPRRGEKG